MNKRGDCLIDISALGRANVHSKLFELFHLSQDITVPFVLYVRTKNK